MREMHRCLACYEKLDDAASDFHAACSRKLFGTPHPPVLPFAEDELLALGLQVVRARVAVTGVQPKLSLGMERATKAMQIRRFTIVGLWGRYILKPPSPDYPMLPEVEDCTMHLAELAGIRTVPHSLLLMSSGAPAYITRRIDRTDSGMLHMEDMCQLTGRLTEHKYHGSHEQIARAILRISADPLLDVAEFYDQVLFAFLTGNAGMHLKNFSLVESPGAGWTLAPAYDMVATALVNPADREELALTLDGRKKNLTPRNFENAYRLAGLDNKRMAATLRRLERAIPKWMAFLERSFLTPEMRERLREIVGERAARLGIIAL
jgi:serine/threonine-protein kinase HipA